MSKLMDELKYQLSKIDFTKYSGDEIEESVFVSEIHSFDRSQAIEFAEWIVANDYRATVGCKNWAKWNPASSTWIYRTTAKLLTEFIEWKKQQEGKGE